MYLGRLMRIKPIKRGISPISTLKFGPFLSLNSNIWICMVSDEFYDFWSQEKFENFKNISLHSCCCITSEGDGTIGGSSGRCSFFLHRWTESVVLQSLLSHELSWSCPSISLVTSLIVNLHPVHRRHIPRNLQLD